MMKKLSTLLIAVTISLSAFAQATTNINSTEIRRELTSGTTNITTTTDQLGNVVVGLGVVVKETSSTQWVRGVFGNAYLPNNTNVLSAVGVYGQAVAGGTAGAAIYGNGNIFYSGGIFHDSDVRFKENIKTLPNALEMLMRLSPKQYNFKENLPLVSKKGLSAGFIAQEVREIFPDLVIESTLPSIDDGLNNSKTQSALKANEKYLFMDYVELIPYIVSGMQEQQKIVEQQSSMINSLLSKNEQSNSNSDVLPKIVSLSPNPATSTLEIVCSTGGKRGIIYIYDVNGVVVKTIQLGENNTTIVPLDSFASGVYITALFVNGAAMDTKRAVIQK